MAQAFILTEEGRTWNEEGINFVIHKVRQTFHDNSDLSIQQGMWYNNPKFLADFLAKHSDQKSYVFVSHENGTDIIHTKNDIKRLITILNKTSNDKKKSWNIIMDIINKASV